MSKSLRTIEIEASDESPAQKLRSVIIRLMELERDEGELNVNYSSGWVNPYGKGYDPVMERIEARDGAAVAAELQLSGEELAQYEAEWGKEAEQLLVEFTARLRDKGFKLVFK